MAREVLEGGQHAKLVVRGDHLQGVCRDDARVGREAALVVADDRVVGVDVEVHNGGQVEVDASRLQRLRRGLGALVGKI